MYNKDALLEYMRQKWFVKFRSDDFNIKGVPYLGRSVEIGSERSFHYQFPAFLSQTINFRKKRKRKKFYCFSWVTC